MPLVDKKEFKGEVYPANFPMRGITINEAINYCRELTKADPTCRTDYKNVSNATYRLPTYMEWQYACRAAATEAEAEKRRDFLYWTGPKPPTPVAAGDNGRARDVPAYVLFLKLKDDEATDARTVMDRLLKKDTEGPWNKEEESKEWTKEKITPGHDIDAFQSAFVSIASQGLYGINNARYGLSFGLPMCAVDAIPEIQNQKDTSVEEKYVKNEWGLYHMLGNVPELAVDDGDVDASTGYFITGGGSRVDFTASKDIRNRVFIWGAQRKLIAEDLNQSLKDQRKRECGFRIVRAEDLKDLWFGAIRATAYAEDNIPTTEKTIDGQEETVRRLGGGRPYADQIGLISEFYKIVARWHGNVIDSSKATNQLRDVKQLGDIDPYFKYLSMAMGIMPEQ